MKISKKLLIAFSASALTPLIVIGSISYSYSRSALIATIDKQISNVSERQLDRVKENNDHAIEALGSFVGKVQLKLAVQAYAARPSVATKQGIEDLLLQALSADPSLASITLVDTNNAVITSTKSPAVELSTDEKTALRRGTAVADQSIITIEGDASLQLLVGPVTVAKKPIAYAIIAHHTNTLTTILQDYSELGDKGETFLAQKDTSGEFRSLLRLRFGVDRANSQLPASAVPDPAATGDKARSVTTLDYRKRQAIATSLAVPGTNWILVTSTDADEILAPVSDMRMFSIIVIASASLVVILLALWLSRYITRPIRTFTDTVDAIRSGNQTLRVDIRTHDEIASLASSFNNLLDEVNSSHGTVESTNLELRHEQARLKASIDSLDAGFIMTDTNQNILMLNKAARTIISRGLPAHRGETDWTTQTISRALGSGFNFTEDITKTVQEGIAVEHNEVDFLGRVLRIFMAPIIDRETGDEIARLGTAILIEDITEEKVLQRSRDEFFSIASHELRTPLTAIRGNANLIRQFYAPKVGDAEFDQMMDDIESSSIRLTEIVNDFLDVSRLEQGKLAFKLESFDFMRILESVIYETASVANQKGVKVISDKAAFGTLPQVVGDQNRVKQVLYNLVGNALKFTENGQVAIRQEVIDNKLKIFVTDTGPGISDQGQQLLFHKFQQAGESLFTRDTSRGTGLGLYISKLLLSHMGGAITLEHSELGKGTTFAFTLPLAATDTGGATKTASPATSTSAV